MAKPGAEIDVVGAKDAGELLEDVIDFIGKPAGCSEESEPVGGRAAYRFGDKTERIVPRDARKSRIAVVSNHRIGDSSKGAKLFRSQSAKLIDVFCGGHIKGAHGIELEELEPGHTEMDAIHHVVAETIGAEGATVTDPMFENIPGVGKFSLIFPENAEHLGIVPGLGLANQAERDEARKPVVVRSQLVHEG